MTHSKPWEAKGVKGLRVGSVCSVYGAHDVTLNGHTITVLDYDGTDHSNIARWFVKFQSNGLRLILPESCLNPTGQVLNINPQKSNMQWTSHSSSHTPPKNANSTIKRSHNSSGYVHSNDWIRDARNNYRANNHNDQYNQNSNNNMNHNNYQHSSIGNAQKKKNDKKNSCILL